MKKNRLHRLNSVIGVLLFGVSLFLLHRELKTYHYHDILRELGKISCTHLCFAFLVTLLDYWILTVVEASGLRYLPSASLPYRRIALASFVGYTFSNNIGYAAFSGGSVRLRFYSDWGLSALEIARFVAFSILTFMLGFCALAGIMFVLQPMKIPSVAHLPFISARTLGFLYLKI